MASYDPPIDSQTDPDAPLTSNLGKRWDNNLLSVLELNSAAPRLRISREDGVAAAGASFVVSGLDDFEGFEIFGMINNISSGTDVLRMELSNDGVSYFGAVDIASVVSGSLEGGFSIGVNLADGVYTGWQRTAGSSGLLSGTIAGSSLSVTSVRLSMTVGANDTYATLHRVGQIV